LIIAYPDIHDTALLLEQAFDLSGDVASAIVGGEKYGNPRRVLFGWDFS